jgi:hypothetical protein
MIGYQDKINQILRGAETIKNMNMDNFYGKDVPEVKSTTTSTFRYNDDALVDAETINAYIEELEEVKLERNALWVKTQEDERIINDLRDVNKQLREEIESDNAELDTAWSKVVELQNWKEEALKIMNQWNEVSDYINLNAEVEDLGRFVPQICLKYLKERDEMKKQKSLWEEDALRYCKNADFWRDKYEKLEESL